MRESKNSTKKFGLKQWFAGLLALLMIVTALPTGGLSGVLTVKAADTVNVYRSYNPNSGEHLLTIDRAEQQYVVSQGRTNEGVAWVAPAASTTPVYRVYNPNSGEHLLVPQAEAADLATTGWNNEGIKLYSDDAKGIAVYRIYNPYTTGADSHLYTTDRNEAAVRVSEGWKWDNDGQPVIYGVNEKVVDLPDDQIEGAIKIEDISGLQSDGTALVNDWLQAIVPATLGSFSNVIFYRDGVQLNSTTNNGAALTRQATRPGKYTVSVIGNDGKVYLSDSIDVVDTEAPAIIRSFSIEDDYATPNIIVNASDTEAVVSVALNKAYNGAISLYKVSDLKYTSAADATESTIVTGQAGGAPTAAEVIDVTAMPTTAQVAATTDGAVLRYVDPETGVATYKWTVATGLTRGTEYKVVFDQNSITSDTPGQGSENEGPNTAVANYLEVPATMAIDSAGLGQPVSISLKDKDGNTMTWMGNGAPGTVAASTFLSQLKVYSDTDSDMKDGTDLGATTASTITKGVLSSDATDTTGNAFFYATAKTISGLFGPKSIDLTSSLGAAAQTAADSIAIAQNSSDPYSADISFTNLRADGTVYVLQSYDATTGTGNNTKLISDFASGQVSPKAAEKVTAGTKKLTLSGAIDDLATNKNHYLAVFVPNDTANYASVATVSGGATEGLLVESKLTSFALAGSADTITGSAASVQATSTPAATEKYILAKDQFGNAIDFADASMKIDDADMTDAEPTVDKDVTMTIKVVASSGNGPEGVKVGIITLTPSGPTTADDGKSFTIKLVTGQTLTAKCKAKGTAAASTWTVSL